MKRPTSPEHPLLLQEYSRYRIGNDYANFSVFLFHHETPVITSHREGGMHGIRQLDNIAHHEFPLSVVECDSALIQGDAHAQCMAHVLHEYIGT